MLAKPSIILFFSYFFSFNSLSCELSVRLESYDPETHKTQNNTWHGVDIDVTQALLQKAQCEFSIVEISWARSLIMLAEGQIDLMINVSKTPAREKSFYFIGPVRQEVIVLATADNAQLSLNETTDILKLKKPIAIQRNAYYGETIKNLLKHKKYQKHFIHVTNNKTKLKLLKRGRISGFLEAKRNIINGVNSSDDFDGIWYQPFVFHNNPIYFALSKKSISVVMKDKIENAFQALLEQGKLSNIKARYKEARSK